MRATVAIGLKWRRPDEECKNGQRKGARGTGPQATSEDVCCIFGEGDGDRTRSPGGAEHDCEVILWSQGVFGSTGSALFNLNDLASGVDFAVLILHPRRLGRDARAGWESGRDNLILELGIFLGMLGARRVLMVALDDGSLIPSDLAGLMYLTIQSGDSDPIRRLAPAVAEIASVIRKLGPRERASASEPELVETNTKIAPATGQPQKRIPKGNSGRPAANGSAPTCLSATATRMGFGSSDFRRCSSRWSERGTSTCGATQ